ncbi:MAG: hypothetical protein Q7S40_01680 [Opitutaceae bacterium]|nr:hypothetical protein [Opitutaceae bacterium]
MEQFLAGHGADVTGVISGFDRLRLRASLRWNYQPGFMKRYLREARVLFPILRHSRSFASIRG